MTEAEIVASLAKAQEAYDKALALKSHYYKGVRYEAQDIKALGDEVQRLTAMLAGVRGVQNNAGQMYYSVPIFEHR